VKKRRFEMLLNKFEKKQSLCFANCRALQPIAQTSRDGIKNIKKALKQK
jgi:hypothetical protein